MESSANKRRCCTIPALARVGNPPQPPLTAPTIAANTSAPAPFMFSFYRESETGHQDNKATVFHAAGSATTNAAGPSSIFASRLVQERKARRISTRHALLRRPAKQDPHAASDPLALQSEERVRVLWEASSNSSNIKVRRLNGEVVRVTSTDLSPLARAPEAHFSRPTENGEEKNRLMCHIDLLFDDVTPGGAHGNKLSPTPPQIDASLASLIYPLTPEYFLNEIWNQKALVIQAGAGRLKKMCRNLDPIGVLPSSNRRKRPRPLSAPASRPPSLPFSTLHLRVSRLLERAHRIVVWMKTRTRHKGGCGDRTSRRAEQETSPHGRRTAKKGKCGDGEGGRGWDDVIPGQRQTTEPRSPSRENRRTPAS